ncbi:hypothetical protein [Streptomyces rubiginosohelvolus]|uniref:hypothetical protein n=1 Tax=Streptomyces rubiginosohelvolus TaxID=67362 RepID=UPI0037B7ADA3
MTTTREGQPAEVTVACPAGYHLTGGGGGTGSQDVYLWKSRPTDDGKGWVAASLGVVSNEISPGAGGGMSAPFKVTAYALCESDS